MRSIFFPTGKVSYIPTKYVKIRLSECLKFDVQALNGQEALTLTILYETRWWTRFEPHSYCLASES